MHPYKIYNSFAELALANSAPARSLCTRTHNSELAALIQDYDRIVKNLESTEQLILTAAQTAQPEVQAELIRPKTKYETELLKAKQKIVDALQMTSVDDFDRSILSAASQRTKTDLTPLLANMPVEPEQPPVPESAPIPETTPPPATPPAPTPPPEQDPAPNIM
jgi:hypothetical protein